MLTTPVDQPGPVRHEHTDVLDVVADDPVKGIIIDVLLAELEGQTVVGGHLTLLADVAPHGSHAPGCNSCDI